MYALNLQHDSIMAACLGLNYLSLRGTGALEGGGTLGGYKCFPAQAVTGSGGRGRLAMILVLDTQL